MKTAIIIPAHNEEEYIGPCLDTFIDQTLRPDIVVVVDDHSSDRTAEIVEQYTEAHGWIKLIRRFSNKLHEPGAKVIEAFKEGLTLIDSADLIGKFDADILLPADYFEKVIDEFRLNPKLGLCSGLLYIQKGQDWIYENLARKSHIRGPVKLYRKSFMEAMGGLRSGIGWDTADVLLAPYYGYETRTLGSLKVKHLRPTGTSYNKKTAMLQGKSYYGLRYGWIISLLASLKMSWNKRSPAVIWQSMKGYFKAAKENHPRLVSEDEGHFIRKYRWKKIREALF